MSEVNWCALLRSKVKSSKGVVRKQIKLLKPHELNKVLLCQEYYRGLKQSTEVKFKDEGTISSNDGKGKRNAMNIQGIVEKLNACTVALSKGNTELKTLGLMKAQTEKAYRVKLAEEISRLREEKYPATLIMELAKGNEQVAEFGLQRDIAENSYYTCISAIENLRIEIETIRSKLSFWGS